MMQLQFGEIVFPDSGWTHSGIEDFIPAPNTSCFTFIWHVYVPYVGVARLCCELGVA
jgi:hypothetical protein